MGPGAQAAPAAIEFGEFEVIVGSADKDSGKRAYPVFVSRSPSAGAASGTFNFDPDDPETVSLITQAVDPADDGRGRQRLGTLLFQTLFVPATRDVLVKSFQWKSLQANRGLRIRLWINDTKLACLPWELMVDDSDTFLATSANTSVVRYLPTPEPAATEPSNILRVLVIFSSPKGAEVRPDELEQLQKTLAAFGDRLKVVVLNTPTAKTISKALQDNYHVVHYMGHGSSGSLYLADDQGNRKRLDEIGCASLFSGRPLPLLLLNACHSANAEETDRGIFSGVAPAIVRQQVAAVIAMQYEFVTTDAAAQFNQAFYDAVLNGLPMDTAVNEARNALAFGLGREDRAWSTPVLYLSTRSVHIVPILSAGQDKADFQAGMLTERTQGSPAARGALAELAKQVNRIERQIAVYEGSRDLLSDIETLWSAFLPCRRMLDDTRFLDPDRRKQVGIRWTEFKQGPFTNAMATAARQNDPGLPGGAELVDNITVALGQENFGTVSSLADQFATKLGTWRNDHYSSIDELFRELNKVIGTAKAFLPEVNE